MGIMKLMGGQCSYHSEVLALQKGDIMRCVQMYEMFLESRAD